jgi:peptide/nickel transport system ATP-binding protein
VLFRSLEVHSLSVQYIKREANIRAVDDVTLSVQKGETLGIVGESGCGKSTLGLALIRLVPYPGLIVGGRINLDGSDLRSLTENDMRKIRGKRIGFIFQDPMTSLNPVKKISDHFLEMIRTHEKDVDKKEALDRASKMLETLGILPERISDYPHLFSGGMRQRVMIGLALALNPEFVIADEPTTALDVIVEAQILELLKHLKETLNITLMLITHNIGIIAQTAERVAVMYAGRLAEVSPTLSIFAEPLHPYTQALLRAVPNVAKSGRILSSIPGSPPDLSSPPPGCLYNPRCPHVFDRCRREMPQLIDVGNGRSVACFLYWKG